MMRHRRSVLLTCILAGLGLACIAAGMADTMLIKTDSATQPGVTFQHRAHGMERSIPCTRCHHNMAQVGTLPCRQCHTLAGVEGTRKLELAFHEDCLGCHKTPPQGTKPPTDCVACHTVK